MPLRIKCPTCRKETAWENNPHRPFCSERCRLIDFGAWTEECYRIPGQKIDDDFFDGDQDDDEEKKLK
jgi:endogenous inhibitor of DNA gyrase (YacG/DUF329 family)